VDDTIRQGVTLEGLSALKPVFPNWGESSTTAGNASGVGDGAGLCILTTRARAEEEGMEILGKYITSTVVGQFILQLAIIKVTHNLIFLGVEPRYMGIAPVYAIPKVLEQAGLSKQDIDVYEVRLALCINQFHMLIPTDQRSIRISICALRRTTGSAD